MDRGENIFLTALVVLFMVSIMGTIGMMLNIVPTWDDRAARKCQEQYGVNTSHIIGEHQCYLPDGTIKALKND